MRVENRYYVSIEAKERVMMLMCAKLLFRDNKHSTRYMDSLEIGVVNEIVKIESSGMSNEVLGRGATSISG